MRRRRILAGKQALYLGPADETGALQCDAAPPAGHVADRLALMLGKNLGNGCIVAPAARFLIGRRRFLTVIGGDPSEAYC